MNTTDWFVFIQQEYYFVPKCFAGPIMPLKAIMDRFSSKRMKIT
jgi:hypothetical protein